MRIPPAATMIILFVMAACGSGSHEFRIQGQLKNIDQGSFYLFSTDGSIKGIDTIHVRSGRFVYEVPVDEASTLILLFPNHSMQPIFALPGKKVNISGDASHLKELSMEGTSDNELMTKFQRLAAPLSPPEKTAFASTFINDHSASPVAVWLMETFFLRTASPDYAKAYSIAVRLMKAQPDNAYLVRLTRRIKTLSNAATGSALPHFSAVDIWGNAASDKTVKSNAGVIYFWASWSHESQNQQRRLVKLKRRYGARLGLMGVSLDAAKADCRACLRFDSLRWSNVCDQRVWDSPMVTDMGVSVIPYNIVVDGKGNITARGLSDDDLAKEVERLLGKG